MTQPRSKSMSSLKNTERLGTHLRLAVSASTLMSTVILSPLLLHISEGLYLPDNVSVPVSTPTSPGGILTGGRIPIQSDHVKWWLHLLLTLSSPPASVNL